MSSKLKEAIPGIKWNGSEKFKITDNARLQEAIKNIKKPIFIINDGKETYFTQEASLTAGEGLQIEAFCGVADPEKLGDTGFCSDYGIRYPYVGGAMAKGISSTGTVKALGRCGCIGFFGAGGLSIPAISSAIDELQKESLPFGFNLIHNPSNYSAEKDTADLYIKKGVRLIEASAYIDLTPAVIKFAIKGIKKNSDGSISRYNRIMAKASRVEVAEKFLSAPKKEYIEQLLNNGEITKEEAEISSRVTIASDITAEADSGGHTDFRPAPALISSFMELKDIMQKKYSNRIRVGFGGGIGTPAAAASAFAAGCSYIVTGSINQSCTESGVSDEAKNMLATASQADTAPAPAADMFEIGAKVQVLKKGTMFAMRAQKLWNLYNSCASIEDIPAKELIQIEKLFLKCSVRECWENTKKFFQKADPEKISAAERDPKFKMALIFRSYLGQTASWAVQGTPDRKIDFQIWTGPAIGAFNAWTKGTFMENPKNRRTDIAAMNIIYGSAVLSRLSILRSQGFDFFSSTELKPMENIAEILG